MRQTTVIFDTEPLISEIQALYPNRPLQVLSKMLSRIVIVFLSTPVKNIDRELGYSGFFPNGYDPKIKEALVRLFTKIINRVKVLWPQATVEYIRENACFGFMSVKANQWVLVLTDRQNMPNDPNFLIY